MCVFQVYSLYDITNIFTTQIVNNSVRNNDFFVKKKKVQNLSTVIYDIHMQHTHNKIIFCGLEVITSKKLLWIYVDIIKKCYLNKSMVS